ncbi:prolyl aminopeptidase [Agrobacterium rubi]|uniref:Proline iminopeptidase n=1 Tax=Agrobacterium rubi TaxID=28099 RepID=A0AAE7R7E9_9HYPH|nr:prolyl aminopeptidase [Agrobacterium rubi]NTE85713.1 prolyl aminopeptidase [Agrobacterium rubi]NTF01645.1 prolyl aminopeptidase [Agrobacterium rubi]NTF35888.1 prolyl aminopeptidase [Agrobacterium rubi]OCJ48228.1 prolyl aminopeptidase [Agrobacterium rubi]QTG00992.1 prolyl aminopeptidase [Agrobacterium rubi]
MGALYPKITPYETGFIDVSGGQSIHFSLSGTPEGKPVLLLHGGPGSGMSASARRYFDPSKYRIIQFDQRGCGLSLPPASQTLADNTTHHLISDIEQLRTTLGVDTWHLYGASWGSTLALAYAQNFPNRVMAIILAGVTTTRKSEIDWLYQGLRLFLPEAWEQFMLSIPDGLSKDDPVAAYYALLTDADPTVRLHAAKAWHAWEACSLSFTSPTTMPGQWMDDAFILTRARLCAHYFHHRAWLDDGTLLRNAYKLTGVQGFLVQGRQDLQGPPATAYALSKNWPGSQLMILEEAGHSANDRGMAEMIISISDRLID